MEHRMELSEALTLIREIPDFPSPGILFRDITPMLANNEAFSVVTRELAESNSPYAKVVGIEARGFILGAAMASARKCGFVPLRKAGKLPYSTIARNYGLEYGSDVIEAHTDAVATGEAVLLVDDVLATGGTIIAGIELLSELGATISEVVVLLEIEALNGRTRIAELFPHIRVRALVRV